MPFTFKLAKRIARIRGRIAVTVAAAVLLTACELPRHPVTGTDDAVAHVIVSPDTMTLDPLQTHQFFVYGRTQAGDSVPVSVHWTATAGTVTPTGAYTADVSIAGATIRVIAWLDDGFLADTAAVTVTQLAPLPPPPPGGPWPNEPAGFTVLTDEPFNALVANGWRDLQRETTNGSGLFLSSDVLAPASASSVLEFKYAVGYTGGREPGVEYYRPATPAKETYFAFWWKPSSPWQSHSSGVNKIAFLFPAGGGIYIMMFNQGGTYTIQVEPEFSGDVRRLAPNVMGTPVVLGMWHRVEWYVKYSTTASSRDGVTRWWLDGVLQGDYRDLQMPVDAGFVEYQLAPTWGGTNGTKAQTDYYWYDHARISKR